MLNQLEIDFKYSQHPVTRTLRGMKNPFEISNVRVNGWPPFNVTKLYFTQFAEAEQKLSQSAQCYSISISRCILTRLY